MSAPSAKAVAALQNTLWGVPLIPERRAADGAVAVVESGAVADEATLSRASVVLAPVRPAGDADWTRCVGSVGRDGDELVMADSLVLETVSYAAAPYMSLAGPTYLSLETAEDVDGLEEDARAFSAGGELPDHLRSTLTIFEAGALLASERTPVLERIVVQAEGTGVSPLSLGSPDPMPALDGRPPSAELQEFVACLLASRLTGGDAATRFSVLPGLVVATGGAHAPTALNLTTLRAYQLGSDAAQLLTAAGREGLDDVDGIARATGIPAHLCDEAMRHCFQAVGL